MRITTIESAKIFRAQRIALAASLAIMLSAALIAISSIFTFYKSTIQSQSVETVVAFTFIPALLWIAALAGIGGIATSFVVTTIYNFRPRWLWRCLIGGALLLLLEIPVGSVAGLIGLIILFRFKHAFTLSENTALGRQASVS